ncbi:diguanylate cyclase [Demequina sp. SO4-18]|uniref:GGDEF domain-containing protein n=1 Tax=Demequina sp. SO4-18 TaxID=3401026 RepID=UPI003B5A3252
MSRWLPDASLTRSRAYTLAAVTVGTILVLQMLTTVTGALVAGRQYEQVSIDTFEYVGELTAERVSRFAEAGRDVAEGTADEIELLGAGMDRDTLELSVHRRLAREPGVRAIYVGWSDGEFLVLRRHGEGFLSQRGGGDAGPQVTTRTFDADFTLTSRQVEPSDYDPRTRPWFVTGTATTMTRWTQPYVDYFEGSTLVSAAHAAREAGEVTAVVGADLNLEVLGDVLDSLPYGEGAEAFVITQDLKVIAAPSTYRDEIAESGSAVARTWDLGLEVDPRSVGLGTVQFSRELDVVVLDRGFPIDDGLPWRLHIVASDEELSSGLGTLGSVVLWITVFSLVMIAVAGSLLWWVRRPLGRLRARAMTDQLTGLLNRTEFYRRGRLVAQRAGERGDVVMVTALDLDYFKDLNDRFGHAAGDQALHAVAAGLTGAARAGDLAARIGGDEFVALHVLRPDDSPLHVAQRVRDAVEHEIHTRVASAEGVGVTAGYTTSGIGMDDLDVLVVHADRALVAGKRTAKGRVYAAGEARSDVDRRRVMSHADSVEAPHDSPR